MLPAASPAASPSGWNGASARSHAQLEVPRGFGWSCVTPCTRLQFPFTPCEKVLPCTSRGSQAGLAFVGRRAECLVPRERFSTNSLNQELLAAVRFAFPLGIPVCRTPGCPAPASLMLLAALSLSLRCPRPHWCLVLTAHVSGFAHISILPLVPGVATEPPCVPQQCCFDTPFTHVWFLGSDKFPFHTRKMIDKQDYFSDLANGNRRSELKIQSSISAVCTSHSFGVAAAGAAGGGRGEKQTNKQTKVYM